MPPPTAPELRLFTLAVALFALIVWYLWARREDHIGYVVPILLWLLNLTGYQIVRMIDFGIAADTISYWGIGLMLQATLTLAGIGFILWREKPHEYS
jgi:hypothetical protein